MRGRLRWIICGLLFFAVAINYLDRQILGILKLQLSQDLGWNERDYANVVTAFQFAYALGNLFGGRMMDWIGVKLGLPLTVFFWSLAAAAHGFMRSAWGFSGARMALGLSEGGSFPAAVKTVSEWFPANERALATGIFNCGSTVGAVVCPLTVPWLAVHWGWPAAFFITGAFGLFWIVAWLLVYRSPGVVAEAPPAPLVPAEPWPNLLRRRFVWAYVIASGLCGPVWWVYLFWVPDFLEKRFHLALTQIGPPVMAIYLMSSVGGIGGGALSSWLLRRGWSVNASRKLALLVCALCVVPVFAAASVDHLWTAVFLVGLAASGHQGWSANYYSVISDVMPDNSISSIVGLGALVAGITSLGVSQAVGFVLQTTGSYVILFFSAASLYLVALAVLQALVPNLDLERNEACESPA